MEIDWVMVSVLIPLGVVLIWLALEPWRRERKGNAGGGGE